MTRIKKVKIQNYKTIKNIETEFPEDAKSVHVKGHNGAGKSSLINVIWECLSGVKDCETPITLGEDKSVNEIVIDKGQGEPPITVTLECKLNKEGKTTRKLTLKVGAQKYTTKKDVLKYLNEHVGGLIFDIDEFMHMGDMDQKQTLEEVLGIDFKKIDAEKRELLDRKLAEERLLEEFTKKEQEAIQLGIPAYKDEQPIDVYSLRAKAETADEHNQKLAGEKASLQTTYNTLIAKKQTIENLQASLKEIERKIHDEELAYASLDRQYRRDYETLEHKQPMNVTDLLDEIKQAEEHNEKFEVFNKYLDLVADKDKAVAAKDSVVHQLKALEVDRNNLVTEAMQKLPFEGLEFTEQGVKYQGLPLKGSQISKGKILELGACIAMLQNPQLKIARVTDASLLDNATKAELQTIAEDKNFIVFYEEVTNDDLSVEFNEVS